jgi:hypothetical protein
MLSALKVQSKSSNIIWFRGQADKGWGLVPFLARDPEHLTAESAVIKKFMQNATPHLPRPIRDEWEWMFLMQHHRAPTRLLDWSESPLTALYFCVNNVEHKNKAGALWCIDPIALNKSVNLKFDHEFEIPAFGKDDVLNSYLPSHVIDPGSDMHPVAIIGPRNTARMTAQLGTFTINHRLHEPIEKIGDAKHIWRWVIPANAKESLNRELGFLGYNKLTLFPDLDTVADLSKELLR